MPTLNNPAERARIPVPLAGISSRQPITTADRILVTGHQIANSGNTVRDSLDQLDGLGGHATGYRGTFTVYATERAYDVGTRVWYPHPAGYLQFYVRIRAGTDPADSNPAALTDDWRRYVADAELIPNEVIDSGSERGLVYKAPTSEGGGHASSEALYTQLQNAQNAAQVTAAINGAITAITDLSLWRGAWAANTAYQAGEYVYHPVSGTEQYFRRRTTGSGATGPAGDTSNWTQLTGVARLSAIRLRNISHLLVDALDIDPAPANRGRWVVRNRGDEEYEFSNPPMQFLGAWAVGNTYYFGSVVTHDSGLWTLRNISTITAGKSGASTEPGMDSDWARLSVTATGDNLVLGDWTAIADGTQIPINAIVTHTGFVYICDVAHPKGSAGPDAQNDRWTLLNNWGGDWTDRFYHSGVFVSHVGATWVATEDVEAGDPAPGASGNTKWTSVGGNTDHLASQIRDLQQLAVDVHLGSEGHPSNYVRTQTSGAEIGLGENNFTLATARAFTNYEGTFTINGLAARYPLVVLPHDIDHSLYRLEIEANDGSMTYIPITQMWNLGNGTRNGEMVSYFSTYQRASVGPAAQVFLQQATSVDHTGTTEFAGILTGRHHVSTYPDVSGSIILITRNQLDALAIKESGKIYIRTD